jgi:hypothetical protein
MGGGGVGLFSRGIPPHPSSSPFPTIASSRPCHPDVRRDGGRGYYLRWRGIPYPLSLLPPLPVRPSAAIPNDGPRGGGQDIAGPLFALPTCFSSRFRPSRQRPAHRFFVTLLSISLANLDPLTAPSTTSGIHSV